MSCIHRQVPLKVDDRFTLECIHFISIYIQQQHHSDLYLSAKKFKTFAYDNNKLLDRVSSTIFSLMLTEIRYDKNLEMCSYH